MAICFLRISLLKLNFFQNSQQRIELIPTCFKKIGVIREIGDLLFFKFRNDYLAFLKVPSMDCIIRSVVQLPDTIMRRTVNNGLRESLLVERIKAML